MTAVAEILGFRLSEEAEELLLNLAGLKDVEDVNYSEFCGIGALAERIGRKGISNRDDLEIVDFNLFNQRLSYININPSLNRLLTFICRWQYNKRRNQTRQFQDQVLYSRGAINSSDYSNISNTKRLKSLNEEQGNSKNEMTKRMKSSRYRTGIRMGRIMNVLHWLINDIKVPFLSHTADLPEVQVNCREKQWQRSNDA